MDNITFDFSDFHEYGPAFYDYLRLRKHFFVDTLGWDIPHDDNVEMDQYDSPLARYSVAISQGRVIGGARCMPTCAAWGAHTYMLRDAAAGQLPDIPAKALPFDIATPDVWECTRLVMSDQVRTRAGRAACLSLIVDGLARTARRAGASTLMSLSPVGLLRALRQLGYPAIRVGEPYLNEGDGRRYVVMQMPTQAPAHQMAAE
ncbi:MAG: acyl-homoserine-lactone synthase [Brevirhabdus sp.]